MLITIDVDDDVVARLARLPGTDPEAPVASRVNDALRTHLDECETWAAEEPAPVLSAEEREELDRAFLQSIDEIRNRPPPPTLTAEERKRILLSLGGSLGGPEGDAFAARVAAARKMPWR